jgi:hypothetical protein
VTTKPKPKPGKKLASGKKLEKKQTLTVVGRMLNRGVTPLS